MNLWNTRHFTLKAENRALVHFKVLKLEGAFFICESESIGIDRSAWEAIVRDSDPRDVPWTWELTECSTQFPFVAFIVVLQPDRKTTVLEPTAAYQTTRTDLWSRIRSLTGFPRPTIPQERAPVGFQTLRRRRVLQLLKSESTDVVRDTLNNVVHYVDAKDSAWAIGLCLKYAVHECSSIRVIAAMGLGEIARLHGMSEPAAIRVLRAALQDPVPGVRYAAAKSLSEVERFAAVMCKNKIGHNDVP